MSEAIKLTPVTTAAGHTEGRADYKGCEFRFSPSRDTLTIVKGDEIELWQVAEYDHTGRGCGRPSIYVTELSACGVTEDWGSEDWKPIDAHADRYHIASSHKLWGEYFDPDENYTDEDWENEPVEDRVKTMESLAV